MAMRRFLGSTALVFASAAAFNPSFTPSRSSALWSTMGSKLQSSVSALGRPEGIDEFICTKPDPSTQAFIMQQTMMRIKDPKVSLDFYTRILGMRLLQELHFKEWEFSIYFVGYCAEDEIPSDPKERARWVFRQRGTVELTHNWGTENDPEAKYHNGNEEPRGFGHIGITVPDVYKACERFEQEGVKFRKTPDGGNMKGLVRNGEGNTPTPHPAKAERLVRKNSHTFGVPNATARVALANECKGEDEERF